MTTKKLYIINLAGGPGSGKSTSAAYLFSRFKFAELNVELLREVVKDAAYRGDIYKEWTQESILNSTLDLIKLYGDHVDIIVTDSPLLLNKYYGDLEVPDIYIKGREIININIFINRKKKYLKVGRWQTEEEANIASDKIKNLCAWDYVVDGNIEGINSLYESLMIEMGITRHTDYTVTLLDHLDERILYKSIYCISRLNNIFLDSLDFKKTRHMFTMFPDKDHPRYNESLSFKEIIRIAEYMNKKKILFSSLAHPTLNNESDKINEIKALLLALFNEYSDIKGFQYKQTRLSVKHCFICHNKDCYLSDRDTRWEDLPND